jgi:hypothetical protein
MGIVDLEIGNLTSQISLKRSRATYLRLQGEIHVFFWDVIASFHEIIEKF